MTILKMNLLFYVHMMNAILLNLIEKNILWNLKSNKKLFGDLKKKSW